MNAIRTAPRFVERLGADATAKRARSDADDTARRTAAERLYLHLAETLCTDGDPAVCEAFRLLGERTGENKYQHAAAIVGGRKPGAPLIDDSEALRRIKAYPPEKSRDAVGAVAAKMGAGHKDAQRWRRKLRENALK